MTASAEAGNMKKVFETLLEAVGKQVDFGAPTDSDLRASVMVAIQSLKEKLVFMILLLRGDRGGGWT